MSPSSGTRTNPGNLAHSSKRIWWLTFSRESGATPRGKINVSNVAPSMQQHRVWHLTQSPMVIVKSKNCSAAKGHPCTHKTSCRGEGASSPPPVTSSLGAAAVLTTSGCCGNGSGSKALASPITPLPRPWRGIAAYPGSLSFASIVMM